MASCQKVPKFDFQSQFSMSKIIWIILIFFSLKNTNLGAHFLLLTFAKDINKSRIYRGWILRCIINLLIYNSLIPQGFVETLTGLGGIIFLISDGCIGINLFYYKLEYAQFIIMSTYYLAQFLITLSGVKTIAEEKANKIRWYTDLIQMKIQFFQVYWYVYNFGLIFTLQKSSPSTLSNDVT